MERRNLREIPRFPLKKPFRIQRFRPGDEARWCEIQQAAIETPKLGMETFSREFGSDVAELSARQFYLCDGDDFVGTATAWRGDGYKDGSYGQVHYVAIMPSHQGMGLSKPLIAHVLRTLADLGHQRVFLKTQPFRTVAIHLYESFGFARV